MAKMKQRPADPKVLPSSRPLTLFFLVVLIGLSLVASQCATVSPVVTTGSGVDAKTPVLPTLTLPPEFYVLNLVDNQTFVTVDVTGTISPDMNPKGKLQVQRLTLPPPPCNQDNKCVRVVLDFRVVDSDNDNLLVTHFDPPMTLSVKYTNGDVEKVLGQDWQNLTLRFWNGERWEAFTPKVHGFWLEGNAMGGFGHVSISEWGDRAVVWGDPD